MDKPEALWLANELPWVKHTADWVVCNLAAAELRRLHAQRDALLEALNQIMYRIDRDLEHDHEWAVVEREIARAAIKAVEEST